LFEQLCSTCHGASGSGISGPSLRNITLVKTRAQITTAIKTPQDPMPKLYPGVLSDADVDDLVEFLGRLR
jgi:mono/diheme cytochrome c family protein